MVASDSFLAMIIHSEHAKTQQKNLLTSVELDRECDVELETEGCNTAGEFANILTLI